MSETSHRPGFRVEHVALSDIGLRRANNQDAYAVREAPSREAWLTRGHLYLVADGMGAHAAGELASRIAAESTPHLYVHSQDLPPHAALKQAILQTNAKIHDRGEANRDFHGMGTTCSVLLLTRQGALLGHVGDSRVYRLRGGALEQLTFDHSLAWEMRATGRMSDSEVESAIPKNIITRSLGPSDTVQVDLEGPFEVQQDDLFLLCSDGLSGQVSDAELGAVLQSLPPEEAAQSLVDIANLRGGPDNITLILARVAEGSVSWTAEKAAEVPPLSYWLAGGFGVVAFVFLLVGWWAAAAAAFLVGSVGAAAAFFLQKGKPGSVPDETLTPLGKGPYIRIDARPNEATGRRFERLCEQVLPALANGAAASETKACQQLAEEGSQAITQHRYEAAVASFCRSLSRGLAASRRGGSNSSG